MDFEQAKRSGKCYGRPSLCSSVKVADDDADNDDYDDDDSICLLLL